jgi:LPPG:FO 2-phospho-L-lactate transferase
MDQLRALGDAVWFNLGDRDLAIGLHRAQRLADGVRLTSVIDDVRRAFGVAARVLPPSDDQVRTYVKARGEWRAFQDFMIRLRGGGPIEDIEYRGASAARPSEEALAAVREASAIVIGPSNPVLSVDPILAVLGDEIREAGAPVVAVSPLVRGEVLKGPTAACLEWAGRSLDSDGIAAHYEGLIDGLVADRRASDVPTLETDVELADAESRRRVARAVLEFAAALG